MRYDYDGKNVIVTGATGGIGKEVAKGVIAGGGSVAVIGLKFDDAVKGAAEEGKASFNVVGEGPRLGCLAELLHEREHEL